MKKEVETWIGTFLKSQKSFVKYGYLLYRVCRICQNILLFVTLGDL